MLTLAVLHMYSTLSTYVFLKILLGKLEISSRKVHKISISLLTLLPFQFGQYSMSQHFAVFPDLTNLFPDLTNLFPDLTVYFSLLY